MAEIKNRQQANSTASGSQKSCWDVEAGKPLKGDGLFSAFGNVGLGVKGYNECMKKRAIEAGTYIPPTRAERSINRKLKKIIRNTDAIKRELNW